MSSRRDGENESETIPEKRGRRDLPAVVAGRTLPNGFNFSSNALTCGQFTSDGKKFLVRDYLEMHSRSCAATIRKFRTVALLT